MCQECGEDLIPLVVNNVTCKTIASCQNCSRIVTLTKEEANGIKYR